MTEKPVKLSVVRKNKRKEVDDAMQAAFQQSFAMVEEARQGERIGGFVVMAFLESGTVGVHIPPYQCPEIVFPEYVASQIRELNELEE